ncbi:MAG TPA: hypothetical protein VLB84_00470 [Bacteroidia bacterium]|nr:hypothetical protein [Bacteroidia bacterium]
MKKIISGIVLLLIHLSGYVYGQGSCPKMFIEAKYKRQYYSEGQELALQYSLIGLPLKSITEEDKYPNGNDEVFANNIDELENRDALPKIYQAIKKNDIILLNERHNRPEHRAFLYKLLDSLKILGINSIFLETLAYADDDSAYLSKKSIQSLGVYTRENVYNQVCGKLKRLDYKVYSYEIGATGQIDTQRVGQRIYFINKTDKKWVPLEADDLILNKFYSIDEFAQREAEQAIHIYQKIIRNNIKKAFIYCGYVHSYKSDNYMAGLLQHLLNKTVYSIDQIHLDEHSERQFESPVYTKFASTNIPFTIVDKRGNIVHSILHPKLNHKTDSLIDLLVGLPRTIYIHNRPSYLELDGDRKRYPLSKFIDTKKFKTDFLVTIYEDSVYEKDKINAVPEDVFQIELESKDYDVILTPNKEYRLFITKDSQTLIEIIITANE